MGISSTQRLRWFIVIVLVLLWWYWYWYPSLIFLFSFISYFFFFHLFLFINRKLVIPFQWPVLGMLPGIAANTDRLYDYVTAASHKVPGCTLMFKGPWLMGLDFLITCDPANAKHIYTTHFSNYPKGEAFSEIFDVLGDGIFSVDGKLWSKQRQISHALLSDKDFQDSTAKSNQDKIEKSLLPFLDGVSRLDRVVDLQDLIKRFTTDVMTTFVLGKDLGCLAPDLPHFSFPNAVDDVERVIFYRHMVPVAWWKLSRWLHVGEEKRMAVAVNVIDDFIAQCIEEKRSGDGIMSKRGKDLLTSYMMCASDDDGDEYGGYFSSDKFIRDTLLTLLVAGTDSVTASLSWFFWLVCKSPTVEQKILEELRRHKSKLERAIFDVEETKGMVYLHAALCESLRLYPPVPFNHKTALKEDILPSGHRVDPGTMVLFCTYATGRMEEVWGEDCLEFKPERWISSDGQMKHIRSHDFLAFHIGPRLCVGKNMAFSQMKLLAASVIYNFHVEMVDGCDVQPKLSLILQMKNGLRVKIKKRSEIS